MSPQIGFHVPDDVPSMSEESMPVASDELIAEMLAGLEGCTPGPWRPGHLADDSHSCDCKFIFGNDDRQGCVAEVRMDDGQEFGSEYPSREEAKRNLAHIARCSPDNIRALLARLSREAAPAEEVGAAGLIERMNAHYAQWRIYDGTYHAFTSLPEQAAAALSRLQAENRILRGELGGLNANATLSDWRDLKARAEAAEQRVADLGRRSVETQILAYKWMEAHDKRAAGKPYDLPTPADVPNALAQLEAAALREREKDELLRDARFAIETTVTCLNSWNDGRGAPFDTDGVIARIDAALALK